MTYLCEFMALNCCDPLAGCDCGAQLRSFVARHVDALVSALTFRNWG